MRNAKRNGALSLKRYNAYGTDLYLVVYTICIFHMHMLVPKIFTLTQLVNKDLSTEKDSFSSISDSWTKLYVEKTNFPRNFFVQTCFS